MEKHSSSSGRACTVPVVVELQHLKHPPQVHRHDRVPDLAPPPHPKPRVFDAREVELPALSPTDPRPVVHVHPPEPVQEAAQKTPFRFVQVLLQRVRAGLVEQVSQSAVDGCHASIMATVKVHDEHPAHFPPPTRWDNILYLLSWVGECCGQVKWDGRETLRMANYAELANSCESWCSIGTCV